MPDIEPRASHSRTLRRVCVFCGSADGARPAYLAMARRLGASLAEEGVGLVYGGASVGLMGAVADAVLAAGGEVIGIIPRSLTAREIAHGGLTELRVVESMHERKAQMAELSDAFIALPGGVGTLEELFEIWTWGQLGLHAKAFALIDVEGFFAPLLAFLDRAADEGFIRPATRALLHVASDPADALARLGAARVPKLPRVIDLERT